jgi:hypothetical protein
MKHERLSLDGVETNVRIDMVQEDEGQYLLIQGDVGEQALDVMVPLEQSWAWTGALGVVIQTARVECGKAMVRELLTERDELSLRDAARAHKWTPHVLADVFAQLIGTGEVEVVRENGKEGPVVRLVAT